MYKMYKMLVQSHIELIVANFSTHPDSN